MKWGFSASQLGRVFAASGALAAVALSAPGTHAQTLEHALAAAYQNNPGLLAERARTRATDEAVPQALANWRPSVTVTGNGSRVYTETDSRTGDSSAKRTSTSLGLSVAENVFQGFRTVNSTRKAENQVLAQRQSLLGVEQNTLLSAATAFMDVVRDQAVLELNINNEQVLRRQLEAAQDRFRVGEITRTDVSQAEARLAGATADRVQAEGTLEASRAQYLNVIGEAPGKLASPKAITDIPDNRATAIERARSNHPNVLAAEFTEAAGFDDVHRVNGERLPSVDLAGSVNRNYQALSNDVTTVSGSVGLTVTVPLYQKGDVFSRLRAARQTAAQLRSNVDNAKRAEARSATSAWETLVSVRARIKSLRAQIQAAEIALEGVKREAEVGSRTVLDVLDAEQELLNAKVNLVRSERDEVVTSYSLKEAMGELTARNLRLPVEIYDPIEHYNEVRDKAFGGTSSGDVSPPSSFPGGK